MRILHLMPTLTGAGAERQLAYLCTRYATRATKSWPATCSTARASGPRRYRPTDSWRRVDAHPPFCEHAVLVPTPRRLAEGIGNTVALPLALHTATDPFRFVYVSDSYIYKHQWTIAEAVCRLRSEGLPVVLELIGAPLEASGGAGAGEGPETLRCGVRGCAYVGTLPHDELPHVYRDAGAFVFASTCTLRR